MSPRGGRGGAPPAIGTQMGKSEQHYKLNSTGEKGVCVYVYVCVCFLGVWGGASCYWHADGQVRAALQIEFHR